MLVLKTSLGSAAREGIPSEQQEPASHPAREKADLLLFESKGLLERYATLSEQVASSEGLRLSKQQLESDAMKLDQVIMHQQDKVKEHIKILLNVGKSKSKENVRHQKAEGTELDIWGHLIGSTGDVHVAPPSAASDEQATSWGRAARHARRGVKHLVKHLPDD